jgi:hypothetical protein
MSFTTGNLYIASPDVIPTCPSPQVRMVLEWTKAVNEFDFDKVSTLIDDGYTHYMLPERSIKAIGRPTVHRGKEAFMDGLKRFLNALKIPGVSETIGFFGDMFDLLLEDIHSGNYRVR